MSYYNPNPQPKKDEEVTAANLVIAIGTLVRFIFGAFLMIYGFTQKDWTMAGVGMILIQLA